MPHPAPAPPDVISPAKGSRLVDHYEPITVLLTPFKSGVNLHADEDGTVIAATNVEDASGVAGLPTWDNESYLVSSNGSQTELASASLVGQSNKVNWRGATWPGGLDDYVVLEVTPYCYSMLRPIPGAAATGCNGMLQYEYAGQRKSNAIFLQGAAWSGSGSAVGQPPSASSPLSLMDEFRAILGVTFTVAQLQALLDEPDPADTDASTLASFKTLVRPYSYYGLPVMDYHMGGLRLLVKYSRVPPDAQAGIRIRVWSDEALTTLAYDSGDVYTSGVTFAIPPRTLAGDTTYYLKASRFTDDPDATSSGEGGMTIFTTLPEGTARLIHERGLECAVVYTAGWGVRLDSAACHRRTASALHAATTYVNWTRLERAAAPTKNWWIGGFEEGGMPADPPYVEIDPLADDALATLDAAGGGYIYDEDGVLGEGENMLFFRTRTGVAPGGMDGFGVTLVVTEPLSAAKDMPCGPGNKYVADPLVVGHPTVRHAVADVAQSVYPVPSGELVVANRDIGAARGGGIFDRWFALGDRYAAPQGGLLASLRPIEAALMAKGIAWEDRLPILAGVFSADPRSLHSPERVRLRVHGREKRELNTKFTADGIQREPHPSAPDGSIGTAPAEAVGPAAGLAAVFVGNDQWRVGANVDSVVKWFVAGVAQSAYTFDPVRKIVTDNTGLPETSRRTYNCGSAQGTSEGWATDLAQRVLLRSGIRSVDLLTSTFLQLQARSTPDCAVGVEEAGTDALQVLQLLMNAGTFHICHKADGTVLVTVYDPSTVDANTVLLHRNRLRGDIESGHDNDGIKEFSSVSYTIVENGARTEVELVQRSPIARDNWLIGGTREIKTAHTTENGARATYAGSLPYRQLRPIQFVAGREAALAFAGGTVLVSAPRALSADGQLDCDLYKVMAMEPDLGKALEEIKFEAVWMKRLTEDERPW